MVGKNRKCTGWQQTEPEHLTVTSTLYTLNKYPWAPNVDPFCSTISRFRDTNMHGRQKSEMYWMITNRTWILKNERMHSIRMHSIDSEIRPKKNDYVSCPRAHRKNSPTSKNKTLKIKRPHQFWSCAWENFFCRYFYSTFCCRKACLQPKRRYRRYRTSHYRSILHATCHGYLMGLYYEKSCWELVSNGLSVPL